MPLREDDIRTLARGHGISEAALGDVLRQFPNDDVLSFGEWYVNVKPDKPHWENPKPAEEGEECFSITAQTAMVRKDGADATAAHLAKFGLSLGRVKKKAASSSGTSRPNGGGDEATNNPWSPKYKGTEEARAKQRLSIIKMSTSVARSMAASAGVRVDGGPLLNQR